MPHQPKVAVVILSWNGLSFLKQFVPPLVENTIYPEAELVVADNCSTDDSVVWLQAEYPQVRIVQNKENKGFAGGYNLALSQLDADYFVLLNQDVEVGKGWLNKIMAEIGDRGDVGAAQPKILAFHEKHMFEYAGASGGYIDRLGYPFCRGRIFMDCEEDKEQYENTINVFWASGACLVVRADLYKELGGLDERFFAHMEEIDLCWRIQNAGYKVLCVPGSVVYHVGGGSLPQGNPRKVYLNFRNNLSMMYKNLPWPQLITRIPARLILDGAAALRFLMIGELKSIGAILKAHFSFYYNLPYLNRMRNRNKRKRKPWDLSGYYSGVIIWQYFVKGKKRFSELPGIKVSNPD
jgi:GT2 family glycosyltransferase